MTERYKYKPILLVEDNPLDVDLTLRAFKKRNLVNPIQVARDGAAALEYIEKWDAGEEVPLIILLDLNLPKVNGLEVLETIKKHPIYKAIPIVVLTSSSDNKDIKTAYTLGANSYIVKPVNFDKFVDVATQIELYWNVLNEPSI
ncbi:MAG: response regulator [Bacteroidales bacterium]|nr:response regulator [Bacteroidales bacterium]